MINAMEASKKSRQIAATQRLKDNAQANLVLNTDINNCIVNAVLKGKFEATTSVYTFKDIIASMQFDTYIKEELRDNGYKVTSIGDYSERGTQKIYFHIKWKRNYDEEA